MPQIVKISQLSMGISFFYQTFIDWCYFIY